MAILGLDYGKHVTGVALSQGSYSQGFTSVNTSQAIHVISRLAKEQGVELIVLGLPEGRLANQVKQFGKRLEANLNIPVTYWGETLTTQEAQDQLASSGLSKKRQRTKEHQIAAAIMLQSYLDENV